MEMEIFQTRQCCHLRSGDFPSPPKRFVFLNSCITVNQNSSVSIPTRYGLNGPGVESRWRRDFVHPPIPALGPTQTPKQWAPGLSRGGVWYWPPPPPSRAEAKERVELYIYSLSAPSLPVLRWNLTLSGKLTPPDGLPFKNARNWYAIWKCCIASVAIFVILSVVFLKNPVYCDAP